MIDMYLIEVEDGKEYCCDTCDKMTKRSVGIQEKGCMPIAICEKCLRKGIEMLEEKDDKLLKEIDKESIIKMLEDWDEESSVTIEDHVKSKAVEFGYNPDDIMSEVIDFTLMYPEDLLTVR